MKATSNLSDTVEGILHDLLHNIRSVAMPLRYGRHDAELIADAYAEFVGSLSSYRSRLIAVEPQLSTPQMRAYLQHVYASMDTVQQANFEGGVNDMYTRFEQFYQAVKQP